MKGINKLTVIVPILVVFMTGIFFSSVPAEAGRYKQKFPYNPIIFVHGSSGSGAQFESQAMRFTSNGYPQSHIFVHEYDTSVALEENIEEVHAGLDLLIANVLAQTGYDQVDVLGHSRGTRVMHPYLDGSLERAAKIAHYVNIDGMTSDHLPGGVPTLALWAEMGSPGREIVGAENVWLPMTTHVEASTSPASFYEMYLFFTGEAPKTSNILPASFGRIRLAGRAVNFPQNVGVAGATVNIFEVNGRSGQRLFNRPNASFLLDEDGAWGPFRAKAGRHYEFAIDREAIGLPEHHFYYEPFIRSDHLIRLNTSAPGGVADYLDSSDDHTNIVISRNKEFWGDQGIHNDILAINGVNVVTETISPISGTVNAVFVYDLDADGLSDISQPTFVARLPFLTGVDYYLPGTYPPDDSIRLTLIAREGNGLMQVINVPNWASSNDRISVVFNDFVQWDHIPGIWWPRHK